jgi:dTDP-L-rhamnose 4-epimerase
MKVLITGGAGFIGSHLVDACRESGLEVFCLDSLDAQIYERPPDYLRTDVRYSFADLRHWQPPAWLEQIEAVAHLAALGGVARASREPSNVIAANAGGTARLLELLSRHSPGLRRLVLVSSFSVYGSGYSYVVPTTGEALTADRRPEDLEAGRFEVRSPATGEVAEIAPIRESAAPEPLEIYGASKYMQELCLRGFEGCPTTILRLSSVYGSRMRWHDSEATILGRIAGWLDAGESPQLLEDGRQIRDWVHVGDVVEAIVKLLTGAAEAPPLINVCSGVPTRLEEACRLMAAALGVDVSPAVVGGYRPGDMRHCLGDATRLTALLARPPLPFRQGAAKMFQE